jgi:hypothetical protein
MLASYTLATISIFLYQIGSDNFRFGIYRGDLSTTTLVGQTSSGIPICNGYETRNLTAISGQNLSFVTREQIVVAFTISDNTSNPSYLTSISNIALATISSTTYISGFPTLISSMTGETATTSRICLILG